MKHRLLPIAHEAGAGRRRWPKPEDTAASVVIAISAAASRAIKCAVRSKYHAQSRIAVIGSTLEVIERPEDPARTGSRQLKYGTATCLPPAVATAVDLITAGRSRAIQIAVAVESHPVQRPRAVSAASETMQNLERLRLRRLRHYRRQRKHNHYRKHCGCRQFTSRVQLRCCAEFFMTKSP